MREAPLFIAEIGLNHNGNFGLAYELIRQAKLVGADIAKFQLGWRAGEGEMNGISGEVLDQLVLCAAHYNIELLFSIFTPEAWDLARRHNFGRYKIASRTVIDNPDLVKTIIASKKEIIISLGMWDEPNLPFEAGNVRYLWCRSKYPTLPWEMGGFPKDFSASPYSGYSDHCQGIEASLLALSRGAKIIEKHFTLDKSDVTIRDHALSATPEEFQQLVDLGRAIHRLVDADI